jgi:cell division protein YceG involved in septum cleavage
MGAGNRQQRTAEERERARLEREARRGRSVEAANDGAVPADVRSMSPDAGPASQEAGPASQEAGSASQEAGSASQEAGSAPSVYQPESVGVDPVPAASGPVDSPVPAAVVSAPLEPELGQAAAEHPSEAALRPIPVKLPPPAPLPPRLPPPRAPVAKGGRWAPRLRVGALLLVVVAVLGGLVAFALLRSKASAKPPPPIAVVSVTIPEGETAVQIAQIASAKGLTGSYLRAASKAARHTALLDPAHYGAPGGTRSLEGFLFPATYEMFAAAPARQLLAKQLTAFGENFGPALERRARALHITSYQLLIVASMIEREALLARDRPRVAAVIYNRLRLGMPLGIDSTIRYALHDYSKPLTDAQLRIDSPYNTRIHHGLPPTPISNPGLAAIGAAAHPAHVPYLYYVNGADGCGELVFSTSYAEFERNAAAYHAALASHGGRVPSCRRH